MKLRIISGFWFLLLIGTVQAEVVELAPNHPERYTVVAGDTLWDIAAKFLAKPWLWREIWHDNPQIADPHTIFPGDELVLGEANGRPSLQVARRGFDSGTGYSTARPEEARLSPTIRVEPLHNAIPAIPLAAIQPFLTQPKVVDEYTMERSPYVVSVAFDHLIGGAGDRVYVRGLDAPLGSGFMIFRPGKPLQDDATGTTLGYEALYLAETEFERGGDPATLRLTKSTTAVTIGDRILPIKAEKLNLYYEPHPPARPVLGHIISLIDSVYQTGRFGIVIIDRGYADGLETGHVLEIQQSGNDQRDIISERPGETIKLPNEKAGNLMVFRAYERVSYALVLTAARAIHLHDTVVNP